MMALCTGAIFIQENHINGVSRFNQKVIIMKEIFIWVNFKERVFIMR